MIRSMQLQDRDPTFASDEAKWQALVEEDPAADGKFYYAVKTTGVYCRPSCWSRVPLRENVAFFDSPEAAERAGFRACKRCCPNGLAIAAQHAAAIAKACRAIEAAEELPTLSIVAKTAGMSPYHFHRVFKATTGLTPKAYALAHRSKRIRQELSKRNSITEAIYEAGFNSNSRFYEKASQTLGMTPSLFRKGGTGVSIRFALAECSLGSVLVAASEKGVCAIFLGDDPEILIRDLQNKFPKANLIGGDKDFEQVVAQVIGLIEAPKTCFNLPLDMRGTAFQQRVWQALREIPAGSTLSYRDLAARIGAPKAVRAVAKACATNSIAVAVPCHRVIRLDGTLSGYRWGVERKSTLLKREAA